jgi:hypothetical protein
MDGDTMTIDAWLKAAVEDAGRRGLPELKPLLETLARSTAALREADRLVAAGERRDPAAPEHCDPAAPEHCDPAAAPEPGR